MKDALPGVHEGQRRLSRVEQQSTCSSTPVSIAYSDSGCPFSPSSMGNIFCSPDKDKKQSKKSKKDKKRQGASPASDGSDAAGHSPADYRTTPGPDESPRKGKPTSRYDPLHDGACNTVSTLSDHPNLVLSAGESRCLDLTDWCTNKTTLRLKGAHSKDINRAVYCDQRNCAVTASRDKDVKMFSLEGEGSVVHTFSGHAFNVSAITVNSDQTQIFSGARDNTVRLWDMETGKNITFNRTARNIVMNAKWIGDTTLVAQSSEDLYLRFWDTRDSAVRCAFNFPALEYHAPGLDCSADGLYILSGHNGFAGEGAWAKTWDVRMQKHLNTFAGHQFTIYNCAFLGANRRDGRSLIITASNDCTVKLWDAATEECVQTNFFNAGRITSMSVVQKTAEKCNEEEADVYLGFLSGMVGVYSLTDAMELHPLVEYGDAGGHIDPSAE